MPERITNDYATHITALMTLSGTTMVVANAPPSELAGGSFRVRVESADADGNPTGVNVEYVNVTALGNPTTVWTVERAAESVDRFPAISHPIGSVVTHVLTAESLALLVDTGDPKATQANLDAETSARILVDSGLGTRVANLEAASGEEDLVALTARVTTLEFSAGISTFDVGNISGTPAVDVVGRRDSLVRAVLTGDTVLRIDGLTADVSQRVMVVVHQDATGGRTLSLKPGAGTATPITIPSGANAGAAISCFWDGTSIWYWPSL